MDVLDTGTDLSVRSLRVTCLGRLRRLAYEASIAADAFSL